MTAKKVKVLLSLLVVLSLSFIFTGCAMTLPGEQAMITPEMPTPDADGRIHVGAKYRMPYKIEDFRLDEYKDALAANGYFYATWVTGEPTDYINSDSEAAKLYEAEIFAIVYEGTDADDALSKSSGWLAAARQRYEVRQERTVTIGENTYTVISYDTPGETSPFEGGISAFNSRVDTAVCIELFYTSSWKKDPEALLSKFLENVL